MTREHEVRFYDRDGRHLMSLLIEFDDRGEPPVVAELVGPDESGQVVQTSYHREQRSGEPSGWVYLESTRAPVARPPAPGSREALLRVTSAREWPRIGGAGPAEP
jgi:hypothetical protein